MTWEEAVCWLKMQPGMQEMVQHCYYDDPVEEAAERFVQSEEWAAVCALLGRRLPGAVLDVGAGRGISSYGFARAGCSVVALEPDGSAIVGRGAIERLAATTHMDIEVVHDSGENLPFLDGRFNIVYGRAVLHHAADLKRLCAEGARVLEPGGVFLATREHVISSAADLTTFLDNHPLHSLYGGESAYTLEQYIDAIESAGLKLLRLVGPFESVINYAPMTISEFESEAARGFSRFIGRAAGGMLARLESCRHAYVWHRGRKCNTPGRHYSFFAVKPDAQ